MVRPYEVDDIDDPSAPAVVEVPKMVAKGWNSSP